MKEGEKGREGVDRGAYWGEEFVREERREEREDG